MHCRLSLSWNLSIVFLGLFSAFTLRAQDRPPSYNRDVRPLLADRCFACHGPDAKHRKAELRLDVESAAKDSAIVPGNVDDSELIARVLSGDDELRMPPPGSGKSLSVEEIEVLKRWVKSGAVYEPYWAYLTPKLSDPPEVANHDWPRNWIDHYVLARLEREGLAPSPDADRITLIRRLYFDLIGLPPSPKAVRAFVEDQSPQAIEKVVDDLLASDRYGERMAMYWLDLVRYADTVGYHGDQDHSISPYRDYVIDAFNANLSFDQFTREQLAGDLLPNATIDQKIATGYNRLLQTSHEGGVQPKEYLAIYAADRVRNFSNVWMGATMGCCQCHDHKFDPYTLKDFYSLAAFFADVDEAQHFRVGSNGLPTKRPPEIKVLSRKDRERAAQLKAQIAKLQKAEQPDAKQLAAVQKQLKTLEQSARLTMVTVSIKPREMRVLPRGNWLDDSGPLAFPAVPEFIGEIRRDRRLTRLDLANWLTDSKDGVGGLTARVMANRIWYLLMGVGISNSLDDFGGQGEPPTHPELLDRLALEFQDGWSLKQLVKRIATSRAYQQTSLASKTLLERDPQNRLYARQSRFRLPAESIRDNALAISDLLVLDYGGPSARPYQPPGYYRHLNFPTRKYQHDKGSSQWRRGVYVHWQRQFLHPTFRSLDAPSREECTARRPQSNTPLAAMALLNDPTFVEAARNFAARIIKEGGDSEQQRLEYAHLVCLSRKPDAFEIKTLLAHLRRARSHYAKHQPLAKALTSVGLSPAADGPQRQIEIAAWTAVARVLLNLSETMTRN